MAHREFAGALGPMSYKQCLIAKELHYECLDDRSTENNYICPETWDAFKHWCPSEVRARLRVLRQEENFNKKYWLKNSN